jgi:hypothetical protein
MLSFGIGKALEKFAPGIVHHLGRGIQSAMRRRDPEEFGRRGLQTGVSGIAEPASEPIAEMVASVTSSVRPDLSDEAVMNRAESILREAIRLGRSGDFAVVPEFFSISATDNVIYVASCALATPA